VVDMDELRRALAEVARTPRLLVAWDYDGTARAGSSTTRHGPCRRPNR
jgi:hypothetical protein